MASNTKPPKKEALQKHEIFLNSSELPSYACADTGAEVSLLSTAVLDAAGIVYDWDSLPDGPCVRGISATP